MIDSTRAPRRGRPRNPPRPAAPEIEKIRAAVEADGRPIPEIAVAAGVAVSTLYSLMNGGTDDPPTTVSGKILAALGKRWADLDGA